MTSDSSAADQAGIAIAPPLGGTRRSSNRQIVVYGVGEAAAGIVGSLTSSLLVFFYHEVLGVPSGLLSVLLLILLLADAMTDFIAGALSDRTRHRWGRRHPYLYASAGPIGLLILLAFMPISGFSTVQVIAWFLVIQIILRVSLSFFYVPHLALGAELDSHSHRRTVVSSVRAFFYFAGTLTVFIAGKALFQPSEAYPNGQMNPQSYLTLGIIAGVICTTSILVTAIGTHSLIPTLPQATGSKKDDRGNPLKNLAGAFRVPSFACLSLATVVWLITYNLSKGMNIYLGTYFWRLTTSDVFNLLIATMAGSIGATLIWPRISEIFGKRPCYMAAALGFGAVWLFLPLAKVTGWFPEHGSAAYAPLILAATFASTLMGGAIHILGGGMVADAADEYEHRYGASRVGLLYGSFSLGVKVGAGGGALAAGILLTVIGLASKVAPEDVSLEMSNRLGLVTGATVSALATLTAVVMFFYSLNPSRLTAIKEALAQRRSAI